MNESTEIRASPESNNKFGCLKLFGLITISMVVSALITAWAIKTYIFPSDFEPVKLSAREEKTLGQKLEGLNLPNLFGSSTADSNSENDQPLKPEPYREDDATREVLLTEKELNALLAKNTELAKKLAVDLSDDLVSAKLLLPIDEDFPMFGGKILRAKAGLKLDFADGNPKVVLKGISIMGVPIPNAWMGGIKNIDLVEEFGDADGFWKSFAAGMEYLRVEEGRLKIKLKE